MVMILVDGDFTTIPMGDFRFGAKHHERSEHRPFSSYYVLSRHLHNLL